MLEKEGQSTPQLEELKQKIGPSHPFHDSVPITKGLKSKQLFTLSRTTEQQN